MINYYKNLLKLLSDNEPVVQVSIVEKNHSIPSHIGSKMLVTTSGLADGTIGGGGLEKKAIEHALNLIKKQDVPQFVEWNLYEDIGMECGGEVKLFFEILNDTSWEIVLFGAGHVTQAITDSLVKLDCKITCVDYRDEWLDKLPDSPKVSRVKVQDMTDYVDELSPNAFVLIMTPGHEMDWPILEKCLKSGKDFPYLGVIGSKSKIPWLKDQITKAGLSDDYFDKFICPVGLILGTKKPVEIAVSVVAQLMQIRNTYFEKKENGHF